MRTVNATSTPEAAGTVDEFFTNVFISDAFRRLSQKTLRNYQTLWRLYLDSRLGSLRLRDVRVADVQAAFNSLHRERGEEIGHDTYTLVKSTASAVFALALRLGHVTGNPVIGTSVRGMGHHDHGERGAYSLDEVRQMLTLFSGQVAAAIGIAAFLGLRGPEMEALDPSDFEGESVRIHRDTKTRNDVRIPVIAPLRKLLPGWTERIKLEREEQIIKKGLGGTSVRWKGWYGFRRGLATNLYALGVPTKTAALILRNSEEVCAKHYIRLDAGKKKADAMEKLEQAFERAELVQRASAGRAQ
jgi:integrase